MLVEINEAYEVLSDPNTKWIYDHHFMNKSDGFAEAIFQASFVADPIKRRHGSKETNEQKIAKRAFAVKRNTSFNRKMKILSVVSLLLGGLIFTDHYLPPQSVYETVYASFRPEEIHAQSEGSIAIFLNKGRKIELYPLEINEDVVGLRKGEGLFKNTPVFNIMRTVQIGKLVLKPFDGLYNIMLIFGVVCLCSIFVLTYKLEESLVLPTILTFFDNMLVLTFFTMWFMEN